MKKYIFYLLCSALFFSCSTEPQFKIEGEISGLTSDTTLYLEISRLGGISIIDSVQLKKSGKFSFREPRNLHPEFYRLRLGKSVINLAIDSTETIRINASQNNFQDNYEITGSDNNVTIKHITALSGALKKELDALNKQYRDEKLDAESYKTAVLDAVKRYKEGTKSFILERPNSTAAYFALYQTIDDMVIYDIYTKTDFPFFAAVANRFHENYPEWDRSVNLYNNVLYALKIRRGENTPQLPSDSIQEVSYFDIALPNLNGKTCKLSDIVGKKVILLDFTSYIGEYSPQHNLKLAELYRKYRSKDFEIFQVAFDPDEHSWKTAADNIPWIAVRDPKHVYSEYAKKYNIQKLPTFFLMDKKGTIVKRDTDIKNLEEEIQKLL